MKGKDSKLREREGAQTVLECAHWEGRAKQTWSPSQVKKGWQELMRVSSKIFPLLEIR